MPGTLLVEWIDPRGREWNLTKGTEGVILDLDQSGLGWQPVTHATARGDQRILSSTVARGIHTFAVTLDPYRVGQSAYDLRNEWWFKANSPFHYGTLRVTRPDGEVRTRRLKLSDTPDTTYMFDPGLGINDTPEAWILTGNGPWWDGATQERTITHDDMFGGSSTPFYGVDGTAYPFYISAAARADGVRVDNEGQGAMWLKWTLNGPMYNPSFGFEGGPQLNYSGEIPPGEAVIVTTDPELRSVVTHTGMSRYRWVRGQYAPAPAGTGVALAFSADGVTANTSVTVVGVEKFASPF